MTVVKTHGEMTEESTNFSERMESLLVSGIFGGMRYLPVEKALIPFCINGLSVIY